jgi:hypothetical protein
MSNGNVQPGMKFHSRPDSVEGREARLYGSIIEDGRRYLGYDRWQKVNHEESRTNDRHESADWFKWRE